MSFMNHAEERSANSSKGPVESASDYIIYSTGDHFTGTVCFNTSMEK